MNACSTDNITNATVLDSQALGDALNANNEDDSVWVNNAYGGELI
ncbi:MAG: hypothetical protein AB4040_12795 [Synechococcus sp.]